MLGRDRLIAGIGLEDILVVETDDVIVVSKRGVPKGEGFGWGVKAAWP